MEKKYIKGNAWENQTQYGSIFNLSISLEELNKLPVDQYGNVKITMMKRRQPDEKSKNLLKRTN